MEKTSLIITVAIGISMALPCLWTAYKNYWRTQFEQVFGFDSRQDEPALGKGMFSPSTIRTVFEKLADLRDSSESASIMDQAASGAYQRAAVGEVVLTGTLKADHCQGRLYRRARRAASVCGVL